MKSLVFAVAALAGVARAAPRTPTGPGTIEGHNKIMGCYIGAWAIYRPGFGSFDVEDIDPMLCTHGFYGFANMNNQTWQIKVVDPWYDLAPDDCDPGYCNYNAYRRFVGLKSRNPLFVPMISIGGWAEGSGAYSMMAADPAKRKIFIDSVVEFVQKYGFEGVDLDWEYPGNREGANPEIDKEDHRVLIEEMSAAIKPMGMTFSAAVAADPEKAAIGYNIPEISKHFDFVNVMTYDYHGWFPNESFTGHNSPLYQRKEEIYTQHPGYLFNVWSGINYWIDAGCPKEKVIEGMPLYGRGFDLTYWDGSNGTPAWSGLYCPASDGIPKGPYTRQIGIWGYQEILQALNNDTLINLPNATAHNWKKTVDGCYQAPYMVNGPYWMGYDDEESLTTKAKFVNFMQIGGAMVWSIDTDDWEGRNSARTFPLVKAINDAFSSLETYDPEAHLPCETAPMCDPIIPPNLSTVPTHGSTTTTPMITTSDGGCLACVCHEHNEFLPYPGDCHKYYRCVAQDDGTFGTEVFTCGDWIFDPNTSACVDPALPGCDLICDSDDICHNPIWFL